MVPHPRLTFRTVNIVFTCPYLSYCQYCFYTSKLIVLSPFIVLSILPLYVSIYRTVSTSSIRQYLSIVNTASQSQYLSYCQYCLYKSIFIYCQYCLIGQYLFLYTSIFIVLSIPPLYVNIYRTVNTSSVRQYLSIVNTASQGQYLSYCQYCFLSQYLSVNTAL